MLVKMQFRSISVVRCSIVGGGEPLVGYFLSVNFILELNEAVIRII